MASQQLGVSTRVLRFFSVYGPGQQVGGGSVVAIFAHAALIGEPLVVQSAGRRDFTDARDVARGIRMAIEDAQQHGGERTCNIATGVGTSFRELADLVIEVSRSRSTVTEKIEEPAGRDLVADVSRAREDLGFEACIPLRAGIEQYVTWLLRQSCS
jgi:UDP-glucose 4-epimerase